jgi:hypothetical protein
MTDTDPNAYLQTFCRRNVITLEHILMKGLTGREVSFFIQTGQAGEEKQHQAPTTPDTI